MSKENDNSTDCGRGGESSPAKPTERNSEENLENPDVKNGFPEKGIDFLRDSVSKSKPSKPGNPGSQELTLSYLCDNSKLGFYDKENQVNNNLLSNGSLEKVSYKGKEVVSEDFNQDECRWVERDFLQLNGTKGNSSKRDAEDDEPERENRDKKPKLETLNLSLALPDVSLSLAASNPIQIDKLGSRPKPSGTVQSLAPSNNTQTTYSNDFTAASLSYSYSHQFSHNPSCSLTRNSTENYEYSTGSHKRVCDQIWNCGEGTNGSVHSRFRPVGDGIALSNHGGEVVLLMNNNRQTSSSDNVSFFPSELPARPRMETQSDDSRGRGSENFELVEGFEGGREHELSRPERILREIIFESIATMAQIIQELPDETIESVRDYLKNIIAMPEKKDELLSLRARLERRSDLTRENLLKSHRAQLEIIVAVKMGLVSFLSIRANSCVPINELVEIFLFERCKNLNCKRLLPVEDCDCKTCSTKKGFCSECMCPVCLNFDCADNTCRWVGCDVCSHWCHADCGIQKNLIRPGPSLKGSAGLTEVLFHCMVCGHSSEMFGFVKDVFSACAKRWALDNLVKELDCVMKIFRGTEDFKGKELYAKAEEMIAKLESKVMSASDVCDVILQFFNYTDGMSEFPTSSMPSKDSPSALRPSVSLPLSSSFFNIGSPSMRREMLPHDQLHPNNLKPPVAKTERIVKDEWSVKSSKVDGFESMESLVQIKEAESVLFQNKGEEARREAEGYRRMIRTKVEKLEEEYAKKMAKLCLQETEELRRKRMEELKNSENAHCDYYKMKMRMQAEIAGLLERMEKTKQQWGS